MTFIPIVFIIVAIIYNYLFWDFCLQTSFCKSNRWVHNAKRPTQRSVCFVLFCLFLYGPFCHGALFLTCLHCLQPFSSFQCIKLVRQSIHFRHSNIIHYLYYPSNTPCRTFINIHKLTKKPAKHVTQQFSSACQTNVVVLSFYLILSSL